MKLFLQIFLFIFTWFSSNATPPLPKVGLPNYAFSFSKVENQNHESEVKIGIQNFARSGIQENSFSQKAIFWESCVLENRAREELWGFVNAAGGYFKTLEEFALTFDKAGSISQSIKQQAFNFYKAEDWNALENLFKNNNINSSGVIWPPANGGYNIVDNVPIKAGQKFDRYGFAFGNTPNGNPNLGGNFTSPIENGTKFNFGQRALNKAQNDYDFYYEIEVLQDLPFNAQNADVIPWFNQAGKGKQSMWNIPANPNSAQGYPYTLSELAEMGMIKITIKSSPSGNYTNFINTVIQQ
jgi:hypothetical protein